MPSPVTIAPPSPHGLVLATAIAIGACDYPPLPRATDGGGPACTLNSDCAGDLPVCDTDRKVCAQCFGDMAALCAGKTPICQSDRCAPCAQHADCKQSSACVSDGSCALDTDVAYVDPAGADGATCTKAAPCTRIAKALATGRPYVKLHGTTDEAVTITSQVVTILADPGARLIRTTTGTILQVTGTSVVEIDDLTISGARGTSSPAISIPGSTTATLVLRRATVSGNQGDGIDCSSGSVALDAATVSGNQGAGIAGNGCDIVLDAATISGNQGPGFSSGGGTTKISRSTIAGNHGGGVFVLPIVANTSFDITNSFLYRNGNAAETAVGGAALFPSNTSMASRFEFNTVVDNQIQSSSGVAGGVLCNTVTTVANNIIVRNLIGNDPNQPNSNIGGNCTFSSTATASSVAAFRFVSPDTVPYDYHIGADSFAVGRATADPEITVDFDGDPRPAGASDQGADQHRP